MNSKLRDILANLPQYKLGDDPITDEPFTPGETFSVYPELAEAEKAIRQAVGEEMLSLLPDEIVDDDAKRLRDGTFVRGDDMRRIGHNDCLRELRQKIKQWQGGEDA